MSAGYRVTIRISCSYTGGLVITKHIICSSIHQLTFCTDYNLLLSVNKTYQLIVDFKYTRERYTPRSYTWSRSERTNNILLLVHDICTFLSFPHITQSLETTTAQNLQLSYFWSCKVMLLPWIPIMCMHMQPNAHFIMSVARSSSHMPAFIYLIRQSVIGAHYIIFLPECRGAMRYV